jgi:hypothetical protein
VNTIFFIPGSILILAIGLGLTIYAWCKRLSLGKRRASMLPASADLLEVSVKSIERVSRFRWVEFEPVVLYRYRVNDQEYLGDRLFLDGSLRFKNVRDAEKLVDQLKRLDSVLYDPQNPSLSVAYGDVSPTARENRNGVLAGGVVLVAIALALLLAKRLLSS